MEKMFDLMPLIMIGLCIILAIAGGIFLYLSGKTQKSVKYNSNDKKQKKETIDPQKNVNIYDAKDILDFEDVRVMGNYMNPMAIVIKKNRIEYLCYIEVKGVNFNLLSYRERLLLEENFQNLLNGINYTYQFYIQSRKVDLDHYVEIYNKRLNELKRNIELTNEKLLNMRKTSNRLEEIQELEAELKRQITQYEYGIEINNYTVARCSMKEIMERKYYMVLSYKHNIKFFKEQLTDEEILTNAYNDLKNKSDAIVMSLVNSKLSGKVIDAIEAGELLYNSYNKQDSKNLKLKNAIKAGFSHLCVSAEPVEKKILKVKLDELEEEEALEIEKLNELNKKVVG